MSRQLSNQSDQFAELIGEIKYASSKVSSKTWTLAEYYNYMADFFDYIELPQDADELRGMAKKELND